MAGRNGGAAAIVREIERVHMTSLAQVPARISRKPFPPLYPEKVPAKSLPALGRARTRTKSRFAMTRRCIRRPIPHDF